MLEHATREARGPRLGPLPTLNEINSSRSRETHNLWSTGKNMKRMLKTCWIWINNYKLLDQNSFAIYI